MNDHELDDVLGEVYQSRTARLIDRPTLHEHVLQVTTAPAERSSWLSWLAKWTVRSLLSTTRFAVAVIVVALVGGILFVTQPFDRVADNGPAAETAGLPPVTGPAGNGLIAFSHGGDIYVGDPVSGDSEMIVDSHAPFNLVPTYGAYVGPEFSPDGTLIVFRVLLDRTVEAFCGAVVVRADGSDERVITPEGSGASCVGPWEWSPDSRSIMVSGYAAVQDDDPELPVALLDASGVADPVPLPDYVPQPGAILRPPDGGRLLTWGGTPALGVMDVDGADVVDLGALSGLAAMGYDAFSHPAWSPDGSRIAVLAQGGDELHLYVMDADGSDLRQLGHESSGARSTVIGGDALAWSPDGSMIAVDVVGPFVPNSCPARFPRSQSPCFQWIRLIDVDTGAQHDLEATDPPLFISAWSWSPDGRALLVQGEGAYLFHARVIDVETDTATELPWLLFGASWQRVAAD